MGCEAEPKPATLVVSGAPRRMVFAAGSRQFADKRSVARSAHTTRFCPKGVGADLSAMGCEAAPNQAASVVSGTSRRLVLLSVPDSSRTSPLLRKPRYPGQAKRRPVRAHKALRPAGRGTCPRWAAKRPQTRPLRLYLVHRGGWFCCRSPTVRGQAKRRPVRTHNALLPEGRGSGLVRDGLRSGTKTGHLGCIWCTEADGFCCRFPAVRGQVRSYEGPDIPDKRSVAQAGPTP
ncbi:hypothetical protein CFBP6411_01347 [Pseudomonas syringae group genomosp. 3]|uniref:Uncharacterized protein n=1 Tax=Pseudomonas syringae group genomosp. 3 TaxID=251701 RepID=A0A2K4W9Z3_9PSED|nr:hypothetical protein CFBP6411_01347 [Pseudomonas syringae group genomosp. 3]